MCIVEVLAAGDRALERYDGGLAVLAGLLDEGRALTPDPDELSASTAGDVIEGARL
jgi:hypothetical protein